jgi:di/tricarboxylate transporter
MTLPMLVLLLIIGAAVVLFAFEWLPADVVALGILVVLILTGLAPVDQAFSGFGSDTVITLLGLFILTAALLNTGVVEMTGRAILRRTGTDANRLLIVIMVASAGLGAFMSNTASTAFFVPIVLGLAGRARVSPSKLLLPLAFSSILTSSVTLVSTSTNLVMSDLMTEHGLEAMGVFELAPVGIPIAVAGLIYLFVFGRWLIPDRSPADTGEQLGSRIYLTEVVIPADSALVGKTVAESGLGRDLDLRIVWLVRDKNRYITPRGTTQLLAGDLLLVQGARDEILKVGPMAGMEIKDDMKLSDPQLSESDLRLVEAILLPRSRLLGQTLAGVRFRERFDLQVLAIYRHGEAIRRRISQVPLRMGDILLIQAHRNSSNLNALEEDNTFHIVNALEEPPFNRKRAPLAVGIFVGVLLIAALNVVSLPVAGLMGVLAVFLTGCITVETAYREVEWRALVLIGSMLALGVAMQHTGAAEYLAGQIVAWIGTTNPLWLLSGFFALTVILTQPMSNQAAAIVVAPVAIQTAVQLGLNPRTFAMMIAVAASTSYLTPLEPSCLMVYSPGNYRFADFLKVGSLLTVIIYGIAILLVPWVWPLFTQP